MRSAIIILITLAVIGGGFLVYTSMQSTTTHKPTRALGPITRQQRTAATQSLRGLQVGESVWVKRYDPKTGELSSQFKGDRYEPQNDGTVHVDKPQAEFFSNDGKQRIRVEGVTGNVVMELRPEEKPGKVQSRMETQAPSSGKLQEVVISMFEPADADEPALVATMNNAAFDNALFRIATEAYADGKGGRVEADQVPVIVRGRDYDFDGRGLVIRWNELDRKLQLLEIMHGESLKVKNPSALSKPALLARPPTTEPSANSAMLASADPRAFVLPVAAPAKAPKRKPPARKRGNGAKAPSTIPTTNATTRKHPRDDSPVVYRASFERDVRIFEADKPIIVGDHMDIDLLQASSHDGATTRPADKSATTSKPAAKHPRRAGDDELAGSSQPATQPADKSDAAEKSAENPATQPAQGPIVVKWSGKLRVVPLDGPPQTNLVPGKAAVRIVGSPLLLMREGTEARAGSAFYNVADQSASLRSSPTVPAVTMTDARGAKVTTPQLDYRASDDPGAPRIAHLIGPSRAEIPVESGAGGKQQNVIATWTNDCLLQLAQLSADKAAIERADLSGAVTIDHPQLNMSSEQLALLFDPTVKPNSGLGVSPERSGETPKPRMNHSQPTTVAATTAPATSPADNPASTLREIIASGAVKCHVIDEQQKLQSIDANTLRVLTETDPHGQTYAKQLQADGKVRTSENGRTLEAGHLFAELAPTTRPAKATTQSLAAASQPATAPATRQASTRSSSPFGGEANLGLVSLTATDNVRLSTTDGGSATADSITVDAREIGREVYHLIGKPTATVSDGKTTITGPAIRMLPDQKIAEILGPGTLHGKQPDDPKQTVDIAWAGGAKVDGLRDVIDVTKDVRIGATQADGTVSGATSDTLQAKLALKPPTTQRSTTEPSTKPAEADKMNFLAGKDITTAILNGNVKVKSELRATDGTLARGMNLNAETVTYDRVTGRIEVPVKGEMLYQDHRGPEQPEQKDAAAPEGPTVGSGRGATAFEWNRSLVYDQKAQHATMSGNVHVVHWPDANGGQQFDLRGETLTAYLEPDPAAAAKAATRPAKSTTAPALFGGGDADAGKFRLKKVSVRDNVRVTSNRLNFDARELIYDPLAQLLTAAGDEASPIVVFDNQDGSTTTASELQWNTRTDQFKVKKLGGKVRR